MKKIFMFSIALVLGLFLQGLAMAQTTEEDIIPSTILMPGVVEDTGTHFEVTDSEYLNIVLDSSETITLRLESIPEMVTMHIEPASEAASTQLTISGVQPATTYYKYDDNYHNLNEFTTDGNGSYSWTQDLSQSHLVFIQPRKSTRFIRDDATGGDCTSIGAWDSVTKTCTLTTDVYETIQIDSNFITLDGNGHVVTGTGTGVGVYLSVDDTIKNLNVTGFTFGIWLSNANNALTNNTISNNYIGIFLIYSNSINNTLTNNTISNNSYGIFSNYSNNNTFTDNIVSNNFCGIYLQLSNSTTVIDNSISNNQKGIFLWDSSNNTLTGNTISNNNRGIELWVYSNNNTLTDNTIFNNSFGIFFFYDSNHNQIYNNNFINNIYQAYVYGSTDNIFNLEKPIGGNYWDNFDTPAEGCYDTNNDSFCDSLYYVYFVYGGYDADYLPWTTQNGWKRPTIESLIMLIPQLLQSGGIDNAGIASSLLAKLNNALTAMSSGDGQASDNIMQAFINQVSAQSGEHISASAAAILINAATYIINN